MKNKVLGFVVVLMLLIGALIYWGLKDSGSGVVLTPDDGASIVYYYGEECPHCKDVQSFLDENHVAEKIHFVKKEVWHNTKNSAEMESRAKICGIQPEGMGVPFVFSDGQCKVGTPDVIAFFKKAAGIE
jgi:glutaredoxin